MTPRLIERGFSLVTPLTIVACAIFAAKMTNDFVEARYIGESSQATTVAPKPVPVATTPRRSKAGAAIAQRNMFCSECELQTHEPGIAVASSAGGVPDTTLPLRLVSTNIAADPGDSFASLENTASGHKGAYWSGNAIPGAGPIEKIGGRYVDFTNRETGRIERVRLATTPASSAPKPRTGIRTRTSALDAEIADKVRKVNDTTWEVDRTLLTSLMSNPKALRGVRVGPAIKNGKIAGFRVSSLSRRSPVSKIGVKRGDIIRAANGTELNSPDVVLGMVTQLQSLNRVKVTVERGGKNIDLTYLLR